MALISRDTSMTRFIRFCSDRGLGPWEVTSAVFSDFAEELPHTAIISNRTDYLSRVKSGWNRLARQKPELKLQRLVRPRHKPALTIPLDQFPAEFQLELAKFRAALRPVDIGALHDDLDLPPEQLPFRPSRPLKPGTVNLRMEQLGYAAGALVHSGYPPHSLKSLRDLFTPISNAKTIIRHLRARGTGQRSSYTAGVVEALRQAARFCQADPAIQAELERLRAVVTPQQQGVVPKNRDRLRAMIEPGTRAIILALPELLVNSAKKTDRPLDGGAPCARRGGAGTADHGRAAARQSAPARHRHVAPPCRQRQAPDHAHDRRCPGRQKRCAD